MNWKYNADPVPHHLLLGLGKYIVILELRTWDNRIWYALAISGESGGGRWSLVEAKQLALSLLGKPKGKHKWDTRDYPV